MLCLVNLINNKTKIIYVLIDKFCYCVVNMKFRKEIIIFSLIIIFMLMSAVSAEENITIGDGADSTSDYVELDSNPGYDENNISENPILDGDENISEEGIEQDTYNDSLDGQDASADYGFNGAAYDRASSNMNMAVYKSSSASHFSKGSADSADYGFKGVPYACASSNMNRAVHESSSASHFSKGDGAGVGDDESSIDGMFSNFQFIDVIGVEALNVIIHAEDIFAETYSSYAEFYSNYSGHGFYQVLDLIINSYDLNNAMELFMESDRNISDMRIISDNMILMNHTFDLNAIPDVCISSYDMDSDLQLSDDADCWHDAQDNSDKTAAIQSFNFSQQINCLSSNMSQDIQHTFYHVIGCECTNTGFTKQNNSYDNLPKVSEFDTITGSEQEDNHDCVLFKKYNVNSPFIVENSSIFALFGVIEITIP